MDPSVPFNTPTTPGHGSVASEPQNEVRHPPLVPDHELIKCIGSGSYGEVWLARNMMGVYRAVKIVFRGSFQNQRPFERELAGIRKFEPVSRSHEGFVDVLHVGINEEHGYFYCIMELADDQKRGQDIDPENYAPNTLAVEVTRRGKLPFQDCLKLGLALSDALVELHTNGLVHRDIKPSNIIFVNGTLKLADIGLVAEMREARSFVGTEGFIPPEGPGTPQADIYSVGKVLYEVSTGKDRQDFPELPTITESTPDLEKFLELNAVILRACKNDVAERYQCAEDVHSDLLVLANGKSVRRLQMLESRLLKLKRVATVAAGTLLIGALVAYQFFREWREVVRKRQQQIGENIAYGTKSVESGDLVGSLPYFAQALSLDRGTSDGALQNRLRFGSTLNQCPKLLQMFFASNAFSAVGFSPDGQRVLAVERNGQAQVFDVRSGAPVSPRFGQESGIMRGEFHPDGTLVVTASEDRTVCVWRVADGVEVLNLLHPDKAFTASFSKNGERIVTGGSDGVVRVWNARTGVAELAIDQHEKAVLHAAFSDDGRWIASSSRDNTARVFDAETGQAIGNPLEHSTWVSYADFSPDGKWLVTACFDQRAYIWEVQSGRKILPPLAHNDGVKSAEFSPDGRYIVTAGLDYTAKIWFSDTHQPVTPNAVLRHSDRVTHAMFNSAGNQIVTSCTDGTLRVWDFTTSETAPSLSRVSLSGDGRRFLTVNSNTIHVRDILSSVPVARPIHVRQPLQNSRLNGNGEFAVTFCDSDQESFRFAQVWNTTTGEPLGPGFLVPQELSNCVVRNDGKHLLLWNGGTAQLWNVIHARPVSHLASENGPIHFAAFCPADGRLAILSGSEARVVDPATGRDFFPPLRHDSDVRHAEFSRDGTLLATCVADVSFNKCYAQIWSMADGRPASERLYHRDGVLFVSFSPDGRRVVTAGEDYRAILWEVATGRQLAPPLRHNDQVRTAAFSPDGRFVVTASSDKTARVWDAETGAPITPPFRNIEPLSEAMFLPSGVHILTGDRLGNSQLWKLHVDGRPIEDLAALAQILSGGASEQQQLSMGSLESLWKQFRAKYPSYFSISENQILAWHELRARECERNRQWYAAAFHLNHLLAAHPEDEELARRAFKAGQFLATRIEQR